MLYFIQLFNSLNDKKTRFINVLISDAMYDDICTATSQSQMFGL